MEDQWPVLGDLVEARRILEKQEWPLPKIARGPAPSWGQVLELPPDLEGPNRWSRAQLGRARLQLSSASLCCHLVAGAGMTCEELLQLELAPELQAPHCNTCWPLPAQWPWPDFPLTHSPALSLSFPH